MNFKLHEKPHHFNFFHLLLSVCLLSAYTQIKMAILNEVNEDTKPNKEVVVNVQGQSEAEESEVDEEFEENTEEGNINNKHDYLVLICLYFMCYRYS